MALVTTTAMNADDGTPDCPALGGEPQSQSNESEYPAPAPATTGDNGNPSSTGKDLEKQDDQEIVPKYGALGRRALLFTPSWFSITMGTGITSILLHNLPYQFSGLGVISVVIFVFNIVLFTIFSALSLARYIIWPKVFKLMIKHSTQAFFLGTFSMGFATIVNMTAFVGIPAFGQGFVVFAWALWWIDALVSLLVGIGVPFAMFNYHVQTLEAMNGAWLLPVVSPIVSSATGGIIAQYLPPSHARLTLVCSYILWGCGFPIAMLVLALYFHRLAVHHLPPRAAIVSVFLPLGPCGQGSFALLQFSKVIRQLAMETGIGLGNGAMYGQATQIRMADAIYAVSIPIALVIWGIGLFWLVIAVGSIIKIGFSEDRFPFNMGWWGFTFPLVSSCGSVARGEDRACHQKMLNVAEFWVILSLGALLQGVFAVSTVTLASELDSTALRVLGTIFSLVVTLLWMGLAIETSRRAIHGSL